jgi:hypothetical protein
VKVVASGISRSLHNFELRSKQTTIKGDTKDQNQDVVPNRTGESGRGTVRFLDSIVYNASTQPRVRGTTYEHRKGRSNQPDNPAPGRG